MLVHQFILVFVSAFRRFESVLVTIPDRLRGTMSQEPAESSKLQEADSEQAA
ncbi:MAG TPA: hypothetical protein VGG15_05150 [Terriglobales bacterium]|jgi:hypothetical protein